MLDRRARERQMKTGPDACRPPRGGLPPQPSPGVQPSVVGLIWVWPIRGISGAWALALVSGLVFGLMAAGLYPGRLARVSGVTRGLFGLYLAGWVAEMGFEGWLVGGLVSALLGMILLMWALQQLEGP